MNSSKSPIVVIVGLLLIAVVISPLCFHWKDGTELSGWSNYGQTISGLFAALAFLAAVYLIKIQQDQILDSSKHNVKVIEKLDAQVAKLDGQIHILKQTAEIHALAAVLETAERLKNVGIGNMASSELLEHAVKAMKRLTKMQDDLATD